MKAIRHPASTAIHHGTLAGNYRQCDDLLKWQPGRPRFLAAAELGAEGLQGVWTDSGRHIIIAVQVPMTARELGRPGCEMALADLVWHACSIGACTGTTASSLEHDRSRQRTPDDAKLAN